MRQLERHDRHVVVPLDRECGVLAVSINWREIGRETFERIMDVLLGREYGERSYAVNGRGGDGGIDYCVDNGKIILQYKYFPEGFPSSPPSRRNQIRRSFNTAMAHDPDEWILAVPCTLTPAERSFVTGLGKGRRVKIGIRDQVWLNDQLATHRDIAEIFSRGSDIDSLYRMAELFKHNPVVRDVSDIADRVDGLRNSIDTVDPDWTVDLHSTSDGVVQELRPKDPLAPLRSPISVSFTTQVAPGSPEAIELQRADAFGYTQPITLTQEMVKDFKITGPRLLGDARGVLEQLELLPLPDDGTWVPSDLIVNGPDGRLGIFLADVKLRATGRQGFTLELKVGRHLDLTLRCPNQPSTGDATFSTRDLTGAPIPEVLETTAFLTTVARGSTLEIHAEQRQIAELDLKGPAGDLQRMSESFEAIRSLSEDLKVIEADTGARFRFPEELAVGQRIMIRSLRLMLEGHCVVHPVASTFRATLNGDRNDNLATVLTTEPKWLMNSFKQATLTILGQQIVVSALSIVALVQLDQAEVDRIRSAFDDDIADGLEIELRLRPGDRPRMFLPNLTTIGPPYEFTPWDLPGVEQTGVPFTMPT